MATERPEIVWVIGPLDILVFSLVLGLAITAALSLIRIAHALDRAYPPRAIEEK